MAKLIVNRLLRLGVNAAGHEYTPESFESLIQTWKDSPTPLYGVVDRDPESKYLDLDKVVSVATDMYVDDEGLVVTQKMLDTPAAIKLDKFLDCVEDHPGLLQFWIKPLVAGKSVNGIVTNPKMVAIDIIIDPDSPDVSD